MSTATFNVSDTRIEWVGDLVDTGGERRLTTQGSTARILFLGTQLEMSVNHAGWFSWKVDGGTWNFNNSGSTGFITLATGLTDQNVTPGGHLLEIQLEYQWEGAASYVSVPLTAAFRVTSTSGTPDLLTVPNQGVSERLVHSTLGVIQNLSSAQGGGTTYKNFVQFPLFGRRGKAASVYVLANSINASSTQYVYLLIDGVKQTHVAVVNTAHQELDQILLVSGLDDTIEHEFRVSAEGENANTGITLDAIKFVGTNAALSTNAAANPALRGFIGDSIKATATPATHTGPLYNSDGHPWKTCALIRASGTDVWPSVRASIGQTTSGSLAGNNGTSVGSTTPKPEFVTINLGTNFDATEAVSMQGLIQQVLDATTTTIVTVEDAFNGNGNAAHVIAIAALPNSSRVRRVLTGLHWFVAVTDAPNDGIHPDENGHTKVSTRESPSMVVTPLSISGPASTLVGTDSTNFTVALTVGVFDGTQTVTVADGSQGGTITPSIGSPGTSTTTVTPAEAATFFTFTYNPASAGVKTLSLTTNQTPGWGNPSGANITANSPMTAGTITVGSVTETTAACSATEGTGNTGSITHQWYLSTTNGFTPGGGNLESGATTLTPTFTGLTGGTPYYTKCGYTDSLGTVYSSQATFTTSAVTVPTAPSQFHAILTPLTFRVALGWADNSNNETGFLIERSTDGVTYTTLVTKGVGVTAHNDDTTVAGGSYWYRLSAVDSAGGSTPTIIGPFKPKNKNLLLSGTGGGKSHLSQF